MESFAAIIGLWPSSAAFGADVGVSDINARRMKREDSIPAPYWEAAVAAAARRGFEGVTLEKLASLAARKRNGEGAIHEAPEAAGS